MKKTKFEDVVQQFQHNVFGNLTVIRSKQEEGKLWFIGKEIQDVLGFINLTQVIKDARLLDDEKFVLKKKNHPDFFKQLTTYSVVSYGSRSTSITFISESGFYKLFSRSNKSIANEFINWVTRDLLPTIRKGVENKITINDLSNEMTEYLDHEFQKYQSKKINGINYSEGGVNKVINYNRNSCKDHSGKTPSQLKKIAKELNMPSSQRSSGKAVLRVREPHVASSMSLTDDLVSKGFDYNKALSFSKNYGRNFFLHMIEDLEIIPKELNI